MTNGPGDGDSSEKTGQMDARAEGARIVTATVGAHGYRLDDLLVRITPENCHAEAAFGRPVGREKL